MRNFEYTYLKQDLGSERVRGHTTFGYQQQEAERWQTGHAPRLQVGIAPWCRQQSWHVGMKPAETDLLAGYELADGKELPPTMKSG